MIKWLTRMWVSDKPSENHYHYFDNRVLPPHVGADLAHADGWWYKPEYIINHMNINSAMFEPRHNSFVQMETLPKTLKVCGYAYTGRGHRIIRAEISLDSASFDAHGKMVSRKEDMDTVCVSDPPNFHCPIVSLPNSVDIFA